MNKRSLSGLVAIVLLVSLLTVACGSKSTPAPTAVIPTSTPAPGTPAATPATLQVKVEMGNFAFAPSTIVVPQGRAVELILHSNEGEHSFTSDELHIDVSVDTSGDAKKTIRVDVPGNYVFYSKLPADKTRGMIGNLVVLPR